MLFWSQIGPFSIIFSEEFKTSDSDLAGSALFAGA